MTINRHLLCSCFLLAVLDLALSATVNATRSTFTTENPHCPHLQRGEHESLAYRSDGRDFHFIEVSHQGDLP